MSFNAPKTLSVLMTLFLGLTFSYVPAGAETLNPEGINPHAGAPRKKITQEQKLAAAQAMKKRKAEIEAMKAANRSGRVPAQPPSLQPGAPLNSTDNSAQ